MGRYSIKWDPQNWVCPHCGTPNPDKGDRCGNCDKNPFVLPKGLLSSKELKTFKAVASRRKVRIY